MIFNTVCYSNKPFAYSFTGESTFEGDPAGDWVLYLNTSGNLIITALGKAKKGIDVHLVGGGGAGASGCGSADHVGIVVAIIGSTLKVVEGNISDKVGYRSLTINGRYIRGYCLPDFASKATDYTADTTLIIGSKPAAKTVEVTVRQVMEGDIGNAVKNVQLILIGNGVSCGPDGADGDFGANTLAAVKLFQSMAGITTDGIVGKDTWTKLLGGD